MDGLTISQIAKLANVHTETVRYYEKRGLIAEPPRTESGYRAFPIDVVEQIKFIKRAQQLDFTLSEIKKLLLITENDDHLTTEEVQQFTRDKLRDIEVKIRDLEIVKSVLQDLSARCSGEGPIDQCPIIQNLSSKEER